MILTYFKGEQSCGKCGWCVVRVWQGAGIALWIQGPSASLSAGLSL